MANLKSIAEKLKVAAVNLKEAADSIYQITDQNNPSIWVEPTVEKVQKDTDTISLSEKEIPVKKGSKKMVATKEDRIKIANDLNKIADKADELEEKSDKISYKRANEIKKQIKVALNHVADEIERLGLDEIVDDEGNEFNVDDIDDNDEIVIDDDDENIEDLM